jgi:hypothetical protein
MKQIYLICMMIIFFSSKSWGLKEKDSSLRVKYGSFYPFYYFVFDDTGTIQMNITTTNAKSTTSFDLLSFTLCTESEYRKLINNVEIDPGSMCKSGYTTGCELDMIKINDTRLSKYRVNSANLYVFIMGNCDTESIAFKLDYTLLNKNGKSQLSVGEDPLPTIYTSLIFIWAFFFLILFFEVFIRRRNYKIELHYLLGLVMLLKIMVVGASLTYWRICSKTGYCYNSLLYLQSFLFAVSESVFFSLLLLVSKGYKITRPNLPREEMKDVSVSLVLLLATLLFFSFYNPGF